MIVKYDRGRVRLILDNIIQYIKDRRTVEIDTEPARFRVKRIWAKRFDPRAGRDAFVSCIGDECIEKLDRNDTVIYLFLDMFDKEANHKESFTVTITNTGTVSIAPVPPLTGYSKKLDALLDELIK